jgi:hypothetical protein
VGFDVRLNVPFAHPPWYGLAAMAAVVVAGAVYVMSFPSRPRPR